MNHGKSVHPGRLTTIKPLDLRRTYARRLFEEGTPPVIIQQNLGHSDLKTTLGYMGDIDIDQRRPPVIYDQPDLIAFRGLFDTTGRLRTQSA